MEMLATEYITPRNTGYMRILVSRDHLSQQSILLPKAADFLEKALHHVAIGRADEGFAQPAVQRRLADTQVSGQLRARLPTCQHHPHSHLDHFLLGRGFEKRGRIVEQGLVLS